MQFTRTERVIAPYLPVYAAMGLAGGIVLGEKLYAAGMFTCAAGAILAPNPLWALAALPFVFALLWWRNRLPVLILTVVLGFALLGVSLYLLHPFEPCFGPDDLAIYNTAEAFGPAAVLEGVIVGYPEQRENNARYRLRVDTLWQGEQRRAVAGDALVTSDREPLYAYGDRLRIRGLLSEPPTYPDFDYRRFLARKDIHTLIRRAEITRLAEDQGHAFWAALYDVRARASAILDQLFPEPYAALANGIILGIEAGIPRDLYEEFNLTGTSHVLVISGSNIAIVAAVLLGLTMRVFRRRKTVATIVTLTGIVLYTLLVGAEAAVVRAAIMGGLVVVAAWLNRPTTALVSLFFAALIMLLLNPLTLWDVGFQLSFMATLGLILFSTPLQRWWRAHPGQRLPRLTNNVLIEALLLTMAAQITTLPLVVYHFGRLSLVSLLANMLVVPVQPLILLGGGASLLIGFIYLPVAQIIAYLPFAGLWWTVAVVERLAALPWASLPVGAFGRLLAAVYAVAFSIGFVWWLVRQEQRAPGFFPPAWRGPLLRGATLAAVVVLALWFGAGIAEGRPDGRLHLYALPNETQVSYLIVTPGGNRALLTPTADADPPIEQLPGGKQHPPDLIIATRPASPDLGVGAAIHLDADVSLTALHIPNDAHEAALFLLRFGDFTALLPFELAQDTQQALLDQLPPTLALLPAPLPGSGHWPHPDLLARLRPQLTLTPVGATYPPEVQQQLAGLTLAPFSADAVAEIISDGRSVTLQARPYAPDLVER